MGSLFGFGRSIAEARSPAVKAEQVELFAALANDQVEVAVVPHKAERVTLQIRNKTDRPLSIEMPAALAAAPVLAQLPGLNFANNNLGNANSGGQNGAPQSLGFGGPTNGNGNGFGMGMGMGNGFNAAGIFNVPAGKMIKVRMAAGCLEFGKPTPNSRIPYVIKPIEQVNDQPEVTAVLARLGREQVDQHVAQLALWHLANGKPWGELARLKIDRIGPFDTPRYTRTEIERAKRLVEEVAKDVRQRKADGASRTAAVSSVGDSLLSP
jgi:hypothetical protein